MRDYKFSLIQNEKQKKNQSNYTDHTLQKEYRQFHSRKTY